MFDDCRTLSELNRRRQKLVREGISVMEINSSYNTARRTLLANTPTFRNIPTFKADKPVLQYQNFLSLQVDKARKHEIIISNEGVWI